MNTKCKCQRSVKLCQLWFVLISLSLHLRTSYWLQIFPFNSYRERRPLQTWVVMQLPPGTLKTVTCTRVNTDKTTGDKQEECTRRTILYKLSNKSVQLSGSCARAHPKLEAKPATNYFSHLSGLDQLSKRPNNSGNIKTKYFLKICLNHRPLH